MHAYDNSDPIYTQVIEELPHCCSDYWVLDCEDYYSFLACQVQYEPNSNASQAWELDVLSAECSAQRNIQTAISDASDLDFFSLEAQGKGTLWMENS